MYENQPFQTPIMRYYDGQLPLSNTFIRKNPSINMYRILEGTQKTLITINQVLPIIIHVTPLIRNASTMFKVARAVKYMSDDEQSEIIQEIPQLESIHEPTNPTFF